LRSKAIEQSGTEVEEGEEKEEERFKEEMKVVVKRRLGLEHRYRNDNHHFFDSLRLQFLCLLFCPQERKSPCFWQFKMNKKFSLSVLLLSNQVLFLETMFSKRIHKFRKTIHVCVSLMEAGGYEGRGDTEYVRQ